MQEHKSKGKIELIIGPMFSGKSTTMYNHVDRYNIANKKCIIIGHSIDKRYEPKQNGIVMHDGLERIQIPKLMIGALSLMDELIDQFDVIGIDELQFFEDCSIVHQWANRGKIVICSALDGNYLSEPFQQICELIPKCEDVIKLKAVCMKCFDDASFTKRILYCDNVIQTGGKDLYMSVCRKCMFDDPEKIEF